MTAKKVPCTLIDAILLDASNLLELVIVNGSIWLKILISGNHLLSPSRLSSTSIISLGMLMRLILKRYSVTSKQNSPFKGPSLSLVLTAFALHKFCYSQYECIYMKKKMSSQSYCC